MEKKKKKKKNREISRGHSWGTTQPDVTNYILAGKNRCPEIAAASASSVPSPVCRDITCLPPHNHDESLWGLPPTAHTAEQWVAMANITTPAWPLSLHLPSSRHFLKFLSLSLPPLSFSLASRFCPWLLHPLHIVSHAAPLFSPGLIIFSLSLSRMFWCISVFHHFFHLSQESSTKDTGGDQVGPAYNRLLNKS